MSSDLVIQNNNFNSSKVKAYGHNNNITLDCITAHSPTIQGNSGKTNVFINETCDLTGHARMNLRDGKDRVIAGGTINKLTIDNGIDTSADKIKLKATADIQKKIVVNHFGAQDHLIYKGTNYDYSDMKQADSQAFLQEAGIIVNVIDS